MVILMKTCFNIQQPRKSSLHALGITAMLVGMCILADSQTQDRAEQDRRLDPSKALEQLLGEWRAGSIEYVVILHAPTKLHYPMRLYPPRLDGWWTFKLVINDPRSQKVTQQLVKEIEKI